MKIDVVFRHEDFERDMASGRTVIVIDVLRATTSMTTIMMNGAAGVIPVMTPEDAFAMREKHGYPLAGERNGLRIENFDFGNSPLEFTTNAVAEKTIVMSTSNGTKSIVKALRGEHVFAASFLNAPAVSRLAKEMGIDVVILCAGTLGKISLEDTACAGMIAESLDGELSGGATEAVTTYNEHRHDILACLRESFHGQDLIRLGFEKDLEYASQVGVTEVAPVLDGELDGHPLMVCRSK